MVVLFTPGVVIVKLWGIGVLWVWELRDAHALLALLLSTNTVGPQHHYFWPTSHKNI